MDPSLRFPQGWGLEVGTQAHACEDVKKSFKTESHKAAQGSNEALMRQINKGRGQPVPGDSMSQPMAVSVPWGAECSAPSSHALLPCSPCTWRRRGKELSNEKRGHQLCEPAAAQREEVSAMSISCQFHVGCCWVLHKNNHNPQQPTVWTLA